MLAIRLQRVGRKNDPSFRVIVADSKLKPKTGNVLEVLGSYNARMGKPIINTERAQYWMSVGAKASGTVHNLLVDLKAVTGKKINVLGKKTPIAKETPESADSRLGREQESKIPVAPTEVAEAAPEVVAEVAPEDPVEVVPESADSKSVDLTDRPQTPDATE